MPRWNFVESFGAESGNRVASKFENSGLTASKAELVDAPVIYEFPLCLECEFIEYQNNEYGYGVIMLRQMSVSWLKIRLSQLAAFFLCTEMKIPKHS